MTECPTRQFELAYFHIESLAARHRIESTIPDDLIRTL